MKSWYEGPLAAFDITTTGTDAERDRIISAALVVQDTTGFPPRVTRWLIDPGVPIPAEAAGAHGLTEEYLHHNGRWPAPVMEEVAKALAEQCAASRPLVVLNAPFRLTVLDRELRRHRSWCLARYLERVSLCVLDPRVLDRHLDHYRQGGRSFPELCAQYDVTAEGAPGPATDATAVMALARRGRAALLDADGTALPARAARPAGRLACRAGPRSADLVRPHRHRGGGASGLAVTARTARRGGLIPAPSTASRPRSGIREGRSVDDGPASPGGRYWVRTSDLFGVNEALSH